MIFRSLDKNLDWNFGAGKSSYALYNDAIVLNIETKLKTFLSECFFKTNAGLPWFDLIVNKNKDIVVLYIKAAIIEIYGVINIKELEYSITTARKVTVKYTIDTLYVKNFIGTIII